MADTQYISGELWRQSLPVPRYVNSLAFAATTAETFTPPADTDFVIFSGTVGFYIRIGGTAAAPSDVTDGTASFYIPSSAQFKVESGVAISVIPTAAGVVTMACYSSV